MDIQNDGPCKKYLQLQRLLFLGIYIKFQGGMHHIQQFRDSFPSEKKKLWGNQIPESNPHAVFSLLHFNFSWVSILPKDVCQLVGCLLARLVAELFCVCLVLFSLIFLLKLVQKKCVSIGERFYQWCSHCFC